MQADGTIPPFATTNRQLAFALLTAGCKTAARDEEGPAMNIYSMGFLRANHIGAGLDIEAAAKIAIAKRLPGKVIYLFERDPVFFDAIKAWDETVGEFQLAEHETRAPVFPVIDAGTIARILCVHANNRKTFDELPWINRAWVSTVATTEREENGKIKITGLGKMWKLGAKGTRAHLKI